MNWRDFLYFSKGERQALLVLLILIVISWIILFFTDSPTSSSLQTKKIIFSDSVRATPTVPVTGQASSEQASTFSPNSSSLHFHNKFRPSKNTKPTKRSSFPRTEKYSRGTRIELNKADTTELKKIPGIGSVFARRIVKYRNLLGGFYTIEQLGEVYGIDEQKLQALSPWFLLDTGNIRKLAVNLLPDSTLRKHPYLTYKQVRVFKQLKKQKGKLTGWENLMLMEEFTEKDRIRLRPYLSFE